MSVLGQTPVRIHWQDSDSVTLEKIGAVYVDPNDPSKLVQDVKPHAKIIRKVGVTIDNGSSAITTGVKGSIQLDFAGTIIGWSIEADRAGSITVEVDKHAGTETAPVVPNTTTDKISASAPIALSSAQTAGVAATGVSTWTTSVSQWDSVQFNVASASTVQRVTLYLRIQET